MSTTEYGGGSGVKSREKRAISGSTGPSRCRKRWTAWFRSRTNWGTFADMEAASVWHHLFY